MDGDQPDQAVEEPMMWLAPGPGRDVGCQAEAGLDDRTPYLRTPERAWR